MAYCPKCRQPLIILEFQGIEVDRCIECGGTWLDQGELERIAELEGTEVFSLNPEPGKGKRMKAACPRCRRSLRMKRTTGVDPAIEIDECPNGHGMWLDQGEMKNLLRLPEDKKAGGITDFFSELYKQEM